MPSKPNPHSSNDFRAPRLIFWTALAVRVLTITLGHTYRIRPLQDHFQFGWEMGRIARALATGYGYADPFTGHTGPTAWVPPLYPLLIAAVFKVAGVYSALSAWILLAINSVFSAAVVPAIYEIAARCYNRQVAIWSAWLWALYPAALQYAIHWVWEMSLTTMLFSFVLALALRMRSIGEADPPPNQQSTQHWLLFGFLWGLIALSNSSLLLFLPACGLWILLGTSNKSAAIARAALASVLFFAVIAPWIYRNWTVFHVFIPMRSNLGAEFYAGSGPGSNGFPFVATLPLVERDPETMRYKALGEIAWVRDQGAKGEGLHRRAQRTLRPHHSQANLFLLGQRPASRRAIAVGRILTRAQLLFSEHHRLARPSSIHQEPHPSCVAFRWAFVLLPLPIIL